MFADWTHAGLPSPAPCSKPGFSCLSSVFFVTASSSSQARKMELNFPLPSPHIQVLLSQYFWPLSSESASCHSFCYYLRHLCLALMIASSYTSLSQSCLSQITSAHSSKGHFAKTRRILCHSSAWPTMSFMIGFWLASPALSLTTFLFHVPPTLQLCLWAFVHTFSNACNTLSLYPSTQCYYLLWVSPSPPGSPTLSFHPINSLKAGTIFASQALRMMPRTE